MKITWLGHASFKIKTGDVVIYIDPFAGEYDEPADIILSSHDHYDHNAIGKVPRKPGCEIIEGKFEGELKGVRIKSVPAYNIGKPFHERDFGVGYLIKAEGKTVYHAGDTDLIPEMKDVKADIAFLPIGGKYTMDLDEARKIAPQFPKVIPMHYNSLDTIAKYEKNAIDIPNAIVPSPREEVTL